MLPVFLRRVTGGALYLEHPKAAEFCFRSRNSCIDAQGISEGEKKRRLSLDKGAQLLEAQDGDKDAIDVFHPHRGAGR